MAHPPRQVLDIWKGNTFRQEFVLKSKQGDVSTPIDLTGSTIILTVTGGLDSFIKVFNDLPDAANGKFEIYLTVEETRLLPIGQVAKYEIERQIGLEQKTLLCGSLNVGGWNNVD